MTSTPEAAAPPPERVPRHRHVPPQPELFPGAVAIIVPKGMEQELMGNPPPASRASAKVVDTLREASSLVEKVAKRRPSTKHRGALLPADFRTRKVYDQREKAIIAVIQREGLEGKAVKLVGSFMFEVEGMLEKVEGSTLWLRTKDGKRARVDAGDGLTIASFKPARGES